MMATNRAVIGEPLTWDAIRARQPDRWVILDHIRWINDTDFDFTDAEVVATFLDRKAASPTMKALIAEGREVGCFWTGEPLLPKKGDSPTLGHLRR